MSFRPFNLTPVQQDELLKKEQRRVIEYLKQKKQFEKEAEKARRININQTEQNLKFIFKS